MENLVFHSSLDQIKYLYAHQFSPPHLCAFELGSERVKILSPPWAEHLCPLKNYMAEPLPLGLDHIWDLSEQPSAIDKPMCDLNFFFQLKSGSLNSPKMCVWSAGLAFFPLVLVTFSVGFTHIVSPHAIGEYPYKSHSTRGFNMSRSGKWRIADSFRMLHFHTLT